MRGIRSAKVRGRYRLHLFGADHSVEGLLTAITDGHYRLLDARVLTSEAGEKALTGEVAVPERNVQFLQRVA